jgi:hypothetical protein
MNYYYKNYIRINSNNDVIKTFSTAFEQPEPTDICVNENGTRHFNDYNLVEMYKGLMIYRYKYADGKIVEKSDDEKYTDEVEVEISRREVLTRLQATDSGMARVAEDLLLHIKDGSPIPQAAIDKIAERQALRDELAN